MEGELTDQHARVRQALLEEVDQPWVHEHMAGCPSCTTFSYSLRRVDAIVSGVETPSLPPELLYKILPSGVSARDIADVLQESGFSDEALTWHDPFTVAVIDRQIEMVEAERRQWGADYGDQGLLFPREDGSPQDPDYATTKFERLAEKCPDVPRIVFHGMRHTHATLLLEDGVSLKVVAERLGDREDTVVKLYGHVTPRGRALAVARVGTWWDDAGPGGPAPDSEVTRLRAAVAQLEEEIARLRAASFDARERTGSEIAEFGAAGHAR